MMLSSPELGSVTDALPRPRDIRSNRIYSRMFLYLLNRDDTTQDEHTWSRRVEPAHSRSGSAHARARTRVGAATAHARVALAWPAHRQA